jgi:sugar/nucleoside kinase (ribokinase family)
MELPAFSIDAVDATGAGDCFVAGLASEILRGNITDSTKISDQVLEDALRFASACGAICTTAVGAGTALQSRGQVEEFLKSQA